jgi:transposase
VVALVTEQGDRVAQAAESVGICTNQLYRWKQEQEATRDSLLTADEKAELLSLRKENKRLRIEQGILKKASVFFAKEMQ